MTVEELLAKGQSELEAWRTAKEQERAHRIATANAERTRKWNAVLDAAKALLPESIHEFIDLGDPNDEPSEWSQYVTIRIPEYADIDCKVFWHESRQPSLVDLSPLFESSFAISTYYIDTYHDYESEYDDREVTGPHFLRRCEPRAYAGNIGVALAIAREAYGKTEELKREVEARNTAWQVEQKARDAERAARANAPAPEPAQEPDWQRWVKYAAEESDSDPAKALAYGIVALVDLLGTIGLAVTTFEG